MKHPFLQEEKKLWKKGYKWVIGLDEAGRGALCGPVVAAAVVKNKKLKIKDKKQKLKIKKLLKGIKDSKKLVPRKRKELYKILTAHPGIKWGIGRVSEKMIDKINILEATKLAMKRAIENLEKKLLKRTIVRFSYRIHFLILDGKMSLDLPIPQKAIVKADEKVFSCACASILAKVSRDRIMVRYHKKYPQYGFDKHKGYPTKFHLRMLKKYRPCSIHRKSFRPVKTCK